MTATSNSSIRHDEVDVAPAPKEHDSGHRRAVVSGTFGTALEWFDFAIYGTLSATIFPQLFFPTMDENTALLASFATFGAGMAARPLGGLVFGALGDYLGRRTVLMMTLVLMGLASAAIGLLPTYNQVGILAPMLLVALRFLQGFSLGGEASGAQVLVAEHAPNSKRGLYGGILATGSPIAQSLAALVLTGLAFLLTEEAFNSWGWRIPFIMGLALVFIGAYIRNSLEESPAFKAAKAEEQAKTGRILESDPKSELEYAAEKALNDEKGGVAHGDGGPGRALAIIVKEPYTILRLLMSYAALASLFWITVTYGVSYLTSNLGYDNSVSFGLMLIANLVSIPAAVLGGQLSDKIGRKNAYLLGHGIMLIGAFSMFPIMNSMNYIASVAIISFSLIGIQIAAATQTAFWAEALPTKMRYTGSAISLTFGALIFGAPTPFLAAYIMQQTGSTLAISLYAGVMVLIAIVGTLLLPERFKEGLRA